MTKPTNSKVPNIRFKGYEGEWRMKRLGEIYSERNERGNDSLQILSVSIHSGISDGELDDESLGKQVRRSEDKSLYKHVYAGDLVLNMMRAWQGAIGVATVDGMVSPAYITAAPDGTIDPRFMDCGLRRPQIIAQMNNLSYGVTDFRKRLYWDSFIRVESSTPSVPEQTKIAAYFSHLDSLITQQLRKHDKLVSLKKAMLQKMFPQPGATTPKIRFHGFSGDWEEKKLVDIGLFYRGISYNSTNVCESGLVVVRSTNIQNSRLVLNADLQFINLTCPEEIRLRKGDIAICMSNGSKALVGKSAFCEANPTSPTTVGAFCSIFRSEHPLALQLLQTSTYSQYLYELLAGTSINNLKNSDLRELIFSVPTEPAEQHKVGHYFRTLDELIFRHALQLAKLKQLKAACLEKLFV